MDIRDRIVRPEEATKITGRSLSSLWRDEQADKFPKRLHIGANAVGWKLSSILTWLNSRETVTPDNVIVVAPDAKRGRKPQTQGARDL